MEGLEALRLLSAAAEAHPLAGMAAEHDLLTDTTAETLATATDSSEAHVSSEAWDQALSHTLLTDLLDQSEAQPLSLSASSAAPAMSTTAGVDPAAVSSGLTQLNKYLNRTWYRAGLPAQVHDDSTQAVYATLLQTMGRQRFDALVGDVGQSGIREVFSRETSDGTAFFRAVDMVKKRAQREKAYQSLDLVDVAAQPTADGSSASMRAALQDAISQSLSPREAALIQDTLMGKTPAEIALQWGVAPKTISNEKSRVLQKLREALVDAELN